jgi:hypothetical protein
MATSIEFNRLADQTGETVDPDNGDELKVLKVLDSLAHDGNLRCCVYRGAYAIACLQHESTEIALTVLTRTDLIRWFHRVTRYASERDGREFTWDEAFALVPWPESRAAK